MGQYRLKIHTTTQTNYAHAHRTHTNNKYTQHLSTLTLTPTPRYYHTTLLHTTPYNATKYHTKPHLATNPKKIFEAKNIKIGLSVPEPR